MADAEARELVAALRVQGWSSDAIGRAIPDEAGRARDGSIFRQVERDARGAGYGRSFVPALRRLVSAEGDRAARVPQPRRPGRVRQPVVTLPGGRQVAQSTRSGLGGQLRRIRAAARRGARIRATITFTRGTIYQRRAGPNAPVTVNLWDRGGIRAGDIVQAADAAGGGARGLASALESLANARPDAEGLGGVDAATFLIDG